MKAQDIMTANPACCTPETPAREAARMMEREDCGCIPVVEDERTRRLVGVVTDRDLALRGVALGRGPETPVRELMSGSVSCCGVDADVEEVERIMSERRVRRVPVIDDEGCCRGMIAQADIAREALGRRLSEEGLARVVERISEPGEPRFGEREFEVRASRAPDERQDSIREGVGAPPESDIGRLAEEERRRRAAQGPQIGGGMGGTSDAESAGDESAMNRAIRDAERRRSERRFDD